MGCPSDCILGDNLIFGICTHDPDTGILTDADTLPSYRIYEDETTTPILTGSMAKLDDTNTTGLYTELIACTTANGFESGKTYTVYIEATVDGDTGGICYAFKIITAASGIGATTWVYTLTDSTTGLPIGDANIWATTDIAGANVVASGMSDQNGQVTFYLDTGTIYIWCQKSGYNFDNPDTETVS